METKPSESVKKLQEQTEIYNVFMQAPVAIMILNGPDYIVELANDFYLQIVQKGMDLIGKPLFETIPELEPQGIKELLDGVMQSGKTFYGNELEFYVKRNNKNEQCFFNFVYQPMLAEGKVVKGITVVVNEITEQVTARKKLEESEHRFRNLVEKAPSPICILKGETMVLEVGNEPVFKVWGVGKEAVGKPFLEIVPEMKGQPFMGYLLDVFHNGATHYGYEEPAYFIQKNGEKETSYYNFVYQPYRESNGSITGVMVLANEVTVQVLSRKKTEAQAVLVQELLMTAPGFVATLKGPQHVYEVVNEKYQQLFGKRKIQGKAIMEALPELEGQGFDTLLDKVYTTGVPYVGIDIPITMARDEGLAPELRYFNFSYQPIRDEEKEIYSILVFGYEVTEQVFAKNKNMETQQKLSKQLEEKVRSRTKALVESNKMLKQKNTELSIAKVKLLSQYSRNLIEATLDPLITIDVQGKITDVNEAMVKATDKTREKLTGSDFSSYFIETAKAAEVYRQVFAEGQVSNYPLTIVDGELTDVLINASVYKDERGKVAGAVLVARDITQLKKIENELTEAKVFAEKATITAENAQGKAEDAVKSKQQFLSNMSHEIRTPMNAIIGFTKVLERTDLSAKQKEYLAAIKTSGDSLIVLINDILDLAKVDAGKMTFQQIPFKMAQSVSAMLHLFETKIQEKNLTLVKNYDHNIPEVLLGDPVRLHQVIINLVSNAVKFTTKGKITVSVNLLNEDEKKATVQFSVKDTGIGIEANEIQGVFENFHQAHSNSPALYEGTGLGLAIVKQLVELQGGSIEMESVVNEGSVFSFILSFEKTNAAVPAAAAIIELDKAVKNIKVLVVEDIALNQMLMKTLLDDFGFECDICINGKLAIEKLATKPYDIILMDLQMPEMNGFEATEYIRIKMGSRIPIIALTADVTTADLAKCKAAGMNDYIAKPVDEGILYNKIVALVSEPATGHDGRADNTPHNENGVAKSTVENIRRIDMSYLTRITKANPKLMTEMISIYLEQTPPLISSMKQSFVNKDWKTLYSAVHKMVPSFSIVGIPSDFETMAKKIQEYAKTQIEEDGIHDMVAQLETVCTQACIELEAELHRLKISAHA